MAAISLVGSELSVEEVPEQELPPEEEPEESAEEPAVKLHLETPSELEEGLLLTVQYDGEAEKAVAILYGRSGKLYAWYDNTRHKPYLLSDIPPDKLKEIREVSSNSAILRFDSVFKYNALDDRKFRYTKLVARDPLAIGGNSSSLREKIPAVWEANVRYANCFMYDRGLVPGTPYRISNGNLIPIKSSAIKDAEEFAGQLATEAGVDPQTVMTWFNALSQPAPNFKRVAVDIEVETTGGKLPDADEAKQRLTAISFCGSDGVKRALVLMKGDGEPGPGEGLPSDLVIDPFTDEAEMLRETFKVISSYPIVLTFNGDNFDFKYLYNRAKVLGIARTENPIVMGRREARLSTGIHIDLFQFFKNRAIQIYAFDAKYKEYGLDPVAQALIGKTKLDLGGRAIDDLYPLELANYCFRDSQITYELTSFSDNLVMKLIVMLMRTSRTGMDDLVRIGVSSWIKNLMYSIHREREWLIPNPSDIADRKKGSSTTAIIKGKKYKGALVINPKTGIYFGVTVLDFASLYPSVLKEYNLSYETLNCPHPECKSNKVPETENWVCTKRKGLASELVGLLRDLRVLWFKPKSKDMHLSNEYRSWYDVAQRALKVFLNASYGVFGAETFPFYCLPVAESTAAIARYVITSTADKAKAIGMNVIYGDTDSLFIKQPSSSSITELIAWARKELKVDLEIDKEFRYVAFSERKKNYFGVKPDGTVDIKGLLGKKRNTPPLIKDTFQKTLTVLSSVQTPADFERAKGEIREVLKETYSSLRDLKFDVKDLAISVMLNKDPASYTKTTPQHIKAAKLLQEKLSMDITAGSMVRYVKTNDGVQPVELARPQDIDTKKYVDLLKSTLGQILDALDLDFDEIMGERTLESFFLAGGS